MAKLDRAFGYLVSDVSRLNTLVFTARVRELGLSRAQWVLMAALYRGARANQQQLAELLGVAPISLGRLVDRMERDGWVRRVAVPGDRRAFRVALTPKARRLRARLRLVAARTEKAALGRLSATRRRALLAALAVVRATLLDLRATQTPGGARRARGKGR